MLNEAAATRYIAMRGVHCWLVGWFIGSFPTVNILPSAALAGWQAGRRMINIAFAVALRAPGGSFSLRALFFYLSML